MTLFSALWVSACTQVSFAVANFPANFTGQVQKTEVVFDQENKLALDVYGPSSKSRAGHRPVLIFFYGGRWTDGKKEQYKFVADRLVKAGYIVVIPDYRKYPKVKFPAFVDDAANAIAWTKKNIAKYGGDPSNIMMAGHSAGGHIGALVLANEQYLQSRGMAPQDIKAFVGLSGPYAFTPDEPDLEDMFGPPENYPNMQVQSFMNGNEPPMFLLHGAKDRLVFFFNAEKVQAASKPYGGNVKTKLYPELDHVGTVSALTWIYRKKSDVFDDMTAFFEKHKTE